MTKSNKVISPNHFDNLGKTMGKAIEKYCRDHPDVNVIDILCVLGFLCYDVVATQIESANDRKAIWDHHADVIMKLANVVDGKDIAQSLLYHTKAEGTA